MPSKSNLYLNRQVNITAVIIVSIDPKITEGIINTPTIIPPLALGLRPKAGGRCGIISYQTQKKLVVTSPVPFITGLELWSR
jgi:hypothetical protein